MTDRKPTSTKRSAATGADDRDFRARATDAASSAREKAIDAYDAARERAVGGIGEAPLAALGAGLAVGALIAALLPRTRIEDNVLGPLSDRVGTAGKAALDAAKTAGGDKLSELNITREAGKKVVQSLIGGIGEAARTSGRAALGAVRDKT